MTHELPSKKTDGFPIGSLTYSHWSRRTLFGNVMTALAFICGVLALLPLIAVLYYIILQGFSSLSWRVFTELPPSPSAQPLSAMGGGFGNAIAGTLIMVGIAALISIPSGILAAIYLTEFSSQRIARWIGFANNVLSGIPSIIAGVFAYGIIVLVMGHFSALAGGIALSVLMLPIIVRTTEESLKLVPQDLRQAALGLGATKFQTVWRVVLPAALPAVATGATLAIARASGETAPLLYTALSSQFWPNDLFSPTPSLAFFVYNFAISPFKNWQQLAWAASFILVLMVLITNITARWATRQRIYK